MHNTAPTAATEHNAIALVLRVKKKYREASTRKTSATATAVTLTETPTEAKETAPTARVKAVNGSKRKSNAPRSPLIPVINTNGVIISNNV